MTCLQRGVGEVAVLLKLRTAVFLKDLRLLLTDEDQTVDAAFDATRGV